jgi:hypothetical protein
MEFTPQRDSLWQKYEISEPEILRKFGDFSIPGPGGEKEEEEEEEGRRKRKIDLIVKL